jgi:transposase InsO family protein
LDHPAEAEGEGCRRDSADPTSLPQTRRTARGGVSEFTEFFSGNGIEHIVTSIGRPSTIGKIEAFHKAYTIEAWTYPTHKEFVKYERPHRGISYLYPRRRILQRPETSRWIEQ